MRDKADRGRDFICKNLSISKQLCFTSGRRDGAREKEAALEKAEWGWTPGGRRDSELASLVPSTPAMPGWDRGRQV